jgi:hypothetical protein
VVTKSLSCQIPAGDSEPGTPPQKFIFADQSASLFSANSFTSFTDFLYSSLPYKGGGGTPKSVVPT